MSITIQRDVQEVLITIQRDATIVELQPILKVNDGGGTAPSTTNQKFTATANQTVFTITGTPTDVIVFIGRNLAVNSDYTYNDSNGNLTLTTGAIIGTQITVIPL